MTRLGNAASVVLLACMAIAEDFIRADVSVLLEQYTLRRNLHSALALLPSLSGTDLLVSPLKDIL